LGDAFGSKFLEHGFDVSMLFHFADFAEPPGVSPGDDGLGGLVEALLFAPLEEADIVGEAEAEMP
jgi:hypothetical protein